jgi:heme-degrading monooxygenase HmoA
VIARFWSANTTPDRAPQYIDYLNSKVLPVLQKIEGFAGAMLLTRVESGAVEVIVITQWSSLDAIRRFAGNDLEAAVVADEAAALLTSFDQRVRHYEMQFTTKITK